MVITSFLVFPRGVGEEIIAELPAKIARELLDGLAEYFTRDAFYINQFLFARARAANRYQRRQCRHPIWEWRPLNSPALIIVP